MYADPQECRIDRNDEVAFVTNGDGDLVMTFPGEWTDDQIWRALKYANAAYAKGVEAGRFQKAAEFRAALSEGDQPSW